MGFCFYNLKSVNVENNDSFFLIWGAYEIKGHDRQVNNIIIANGIRDEAKACDLEVTWDGSLKGNIHVKANKNKAK
jgi:hypothetical protein